MPNNWHVLYKTVSSIRDSSNKGKNPSIFDLHKSPPSTRLSGARSISTASMRIDKINSKQRRQTTYRLAGCKDRLSPGPIGQRHCQAVCHQRQHHLPTRSAPRMVQERGVRLSGTRAGATARSCRQAARPPRTAHRRPSAPRRRGRGLAGVTGGLVTQALSDHRENNHHGKPYGGSRWAHDRAAERAGS